MLAYLSLQKNFYSYFRIFILWLPSMKRKKEQHSIVLCLLVADLWGPWSGISCATPHWSFEKEKRSRKKIKGQSSTMFYSVSLSAVLTASCAFSKRNVRPDVCVLCSPTQISLVPDLGFLLSCMGMPACNSFSVCEQERNSLFFERLGNERSGKVGRSGKIRVIGCKGREILGL